jgi:uncharacterized membrane protein (DUF2068 family)
VNERRIAGLLAFLAVFDVVLTVWAGAFPELWMAAFHGVALDDPQQLLRRCAANWAAFALVQAIAFARWREHPEWLAVVAGVRLSDIFTDATVIALARDTTWFAKATLAPMSVINLLMGLWLLRAYRWRVTASAPRVQPGAE